MEELLRDNLEAKRRGNLQDASAIDLSQSKRARREIPDLLSWVQCFGTYLAVSATKHPDRLRHLLAYQTLVVHEARRCRGRGWLAYDTMFASKSLAMSKQTGRSSTAPRMLSHSWRSSTRTRAALYAWKWTTWRRSVPWPALSSRNSSMVAARWVHSRYLLPGLRPGPAAVAGSSQGGKRGFAFNHGECVYPYCRFSHACLKCGSLVCCQPGSDGPRSSIWELRHPAGCDGPDYPLIRQLSLHEGSEGDGLLQAGEPSGGAGRAVGYSHALAALELEGGAEAAPRPAVRSFSCAQSGTGIPDRAGHGWQNSISRAPIVWCRCTPRTTCSLGMS